MEQDKQLKEILLNSVEEPSAGFTNAVMGKINALSATSFQYQPLVSARLKKIFVITYGASIAAIVVLCFIVAFGDSFIVNRIQRIELPEVNYGKIFMFLFIFWMVFSAKIMFEKKWFLRQ